MSMYSDALIGLGAYTDQQLEQYRQGKKTRRETYYSCKAYVQCLMYNDLIGDGYGMNVIERISELLSEIASDKNASIKITFQK